jgi:hypothetical protein
MAKAFMVAAISLALLTGCDAVFTYSALTGLQRDPKDMSLEQRIKFAEDALASGDEGAMADAYDAIKGTAATSNDGDLELLAGQLALELSGINDAIGDLANINFDDPDTAATEALVQSIVDSLTPSLVTDAAGFYADAADPTHGGDLTGTDYLLGAMAILADAAVTAGSVGAADPTAANDMLTAALGALSPDDPAVDLITQFQTWLATL